MKLLIVESPNKVDKIQSFLDSKEWKVIATVGHIRENVTYGKHYLGIDIETMTPQYKNSTGKADVIKTLSSEIKKADEVYLATDPDREGEAIAWHVTQIADDDSAIFQRVTFNEITKDAVLKAIEEPRDIDMDLVHSQEARSSLDQMMGFKLSNLVRQKVQGRSAGRVKSAVMKLIMEKEGEIRDFTPDTWFEVEGAVTEEIILKASDSKGKEIKFDKEEQANLHKEGTNLPLNFVDRKEGVTKTRAVMPLEMSSALSGAYTAFGYSNARTTQLLQSLYMKGYITYPRTDSKRYSGEFVVEANKFIAKEYGSDMIENKIVKSNGGQDAHEAIRPTKISATEEDLKLTPQEKKMYSYIRRTTLKSMMIAGENLNLTEVYESNSNHYVLKRSLVLTPGYRVVDGVKTDGEAISKDFKPVDTAKVDIQVISKQTKPPARYNQASIIKTMKELGIGRPSTYSATTKGLLGHGYLEQDGGALIPTEMGEDVNKVLLIKFEDMIEAGYTAKMESELDAIATSEVDWKEFLNEFWTKFEPRVQEAEGSIEKKEAKVVGKCPDCGSDLVLRRSRYGKEFAGCSNFPKCKHIMDWDSENMQTREVKLPEYTNKKCPLCESNLIIKERKRDGNKFLACPRFPKCKHAENMTDDVEFISISEAFVKE